MYVPKRATRLLPDSKDKINSYPRYEGGSPRSKLGHNKNNNNNNNSTTCSAGHFLRSGVRGRTCVVANRSRAPSDAVLRHTYCMSKNKIKNFP